MLRIPKTPERVIQNLTDLGVLVSASEWERAALVYALTREGEAGRPTENAREVVHFPVAVREFARLGVHGLTTQDTVRRYRNAWKSTGRDAALGMSVSTSGLGEFPPDLVSAGRTIKEPERREAIRQQAVADGVGSSKALDIASNPKAMASAIKADPKLAEVAAKALVAMGRSTSSSTPEQEVEIAKRVIKDPVRGKQVFREPQVRLAASRAEREVITEEHEALVRNNALEDPEEHADQQARRAKSHVVVVSVEFNDRLYHARQDLLRAMDCWNEVGGPMADEHRAAVIEKIDAVTNIATAIRQAVKGGTTLDEDFAAMLKEG